MMMGVYSRTLGNKTEYALVSKGTSKFVNWADNLLQPIGMSPDMFCSKLAGSIFVKSHPDNEITFIGHSKGRAEALVNAWANNKNCIVFNPAAVNLLDKSNLSRTYSAKLTVFVVRGEALTITRFLSDIFNRNIVYLNRKYSWWHTIKNHHMDAVIWGLENAGYN